MQRIQHRPRNQAASALVRDLYGGLERGRSDNVAYPGAFLQLPLASGGEVFTCDLLSEEFGAGWAQGMTSPVIEDGNLRPSGRTVLTFSDEGGL